MCCCFIVAVLFYRDTNPQLNKNSSIQKNKLKKKEKKEKSKSLQTHRVPGTHYIEGIHDEWTKCKFFYCIILACIVTRIS